MHRFAKTIRPFLPLVLILSAAAPLTAQAVDSAALKYDLLKKNWLVAATLEYVAPITGHTYAGNWKRGIAPTAVSLAGAGLLFGVASWDISHSEDHSSLFWVGAGMLFGGRAWGVVSAAHTARVYNRRLKELLHITPQPNGSVGIRVDLSLEEGRAR